MPDVRLANVSKHFGEIIALKEANLEIRDGEYVILLGPSGCGKTTLLRMIAGTLRPTRGKVSIGNRDVTDAEPEDRFVGFVFQNYALFPHMTVLQNTMYGPLVRGVDFGDAEKTAHEMLELVRLAVRHDAFPRELSGGMQQRLGVARALATGSKLLLLDEPLSALDAKIKAELQIEMRKMAKDLKLTVVHVTHDQDEAMLMGDRIVVMRNGSIEQSGTPQEIYYRPKSLFVAYFVGEGNFIKSEVTKKGNGFFVNILGKSMPVKKPDGFRRVAMVRPEKIRIGNRGVNGTIENVRMMGGLVRYEIKVLTETIIAKALTDDKIYNIKDSVKVDVDLKDVLLFKYPKKGLKEALRVD